MRKIYILLLLCMALSASLFAASSPYDFSRFDRALIAVDTFAGDRHGQFQGDLVAILDDGSQWKIHPQDTKKFRNWKMNETVHVDFRERDYWFKREHHTLLVNHKRGETVRTMLVKYPDQPLKITEAVMSDAAIWGSTMSSLQWVTGKRLTLNDGTEWYLYRSGALAFRRGMKVYVSYFTLPNSNKRGYFIIKGSQREVTIITAYSAEQHDFHE